MKKIALLLIVIAYASISLSQTAPPEGINYQAVAIDTEGDETPGVDVSNQPISNKEIDVRFSIIKTSVAGTLVYSETHNLMTDEFGLFNTVIGQGVVDGGTGLFSQIEWEKDKFFLKVEIDIQKGKGYRDMGTQQLWSVPYALYSKYANKAGNGIKNVTDNGDGTITFTYIDNSSYTTPVLAGLTGPQGIQGIQGLTGAIGAAGSNGTNGAQGPIGLTGSQGPIGLTGAKGDTGATGLQGPIGQTGTAGSNGTNGAQGPIGLTGPQGTQGIQGLTGATGLQGPIGQTGAVGSNGTNGAQGPIGLTGAKGDTGLQGPIGQTGSAGTNGTNGLQGPTGLTGPQGTQGIQGSPGLLNNGTSTGNTSYWNGSQWVVNSSNIHNNGSEIGINTSSPNASAQLDVTSTTKGFLPPRMTTAQRNAITSPAAGLTIYNTTVNCLQWWNGTIWYDGCGNNPPSTGTPTYPIGSVFCASGPTVIVDVTNPISGETWMDRNLGATRVATSSTDASSYGDLYQWGRGNDGHQCRTSSTTNTLSSTDQPGNGNFILAPNSPNQWRSPQNANLWQGVNGVNNPCPSGYRIPTEPELNVESITWNTSGGNAGAFGAMGRAVKWPTPGYRDRSSGLLQAVGNRGSYWSSTLANITAAYYLYFQSANDFIGGIQPAVGFSVRCIKD